MPRPNLTDNFIHKSRKFGKSPQKANGISFWVFLLSTFIYISIFYIFKLSPLALFNTTEFWFFISNTLILIIAADFGAFSSSRKHDYLDEYVKNTQARIPHPHEYQNLEIVEKKFVQQQEATLDHQKPQEKIQEVIFHQKSESKAENEVLSITYRDYDQNNGKKNSPELKEDQVTISKVDNYEEKKKKRKCTRTKSDKIILAANDEKKIQRSQSERYDYDINHEKMVEDQNEFSTMSDEELNRRVEEFIQRFNTQIRLQAAKDRQNFRVHEV